MLIALDYDNTWTKSPVLWAQIVSLFKSHGHNFICVTSRADTIDNRRQLNESIGVLMPIIYCNHTPKKKQAKQAGFKPDIWIDDRPETIPTHVRQWKVTNH